MTISDPAAFLQGSLGHYPGDAHKALRAAIRHAIDFVGQAPEPYEIEALSKWDAVRVEWELDSLYMRIDFGPKGMADLIVEGAVVFEMEPSDKAKACELLSLIVKHLEPRDAV